MSDIEAKYKRMVWTYYHTVFKDTMYMMRKVSNKVWPNNPRQVFGNNIKYESVSYNLCLRLFRSERCSG